jgi:hypothetical protein
VFSNIRTLEIIMPKKDKQMQPPGPIWTLEAWIEHAQDIRENDQRALQIKQEADEKALDLARQQQTYKDEKANELREQIASERGLYATKEDLNTLEAKLAAKQDADRTSGRALFFSILGLIGIFSGTIIILFTSGAFK